jgi:hypothetical protein
MILENYFNFMGVRPPTTGTTFWWGSVGWGGVGWGVFLFDGNDVYYYCFIEEVV